MTLWFPTYITQLTEAKRAEDFREMCNVTVQEDTLERFCGCSNTMFANFALEDTQLKDLMLGDVIFSNVSFRNVSFDTVLFSGTEFVNCEFSESNFTRTLFKGTDFNHVLFNSVSIRLSSMCPLNSTGVVDVTNLWTHQNVNISGHRVDNRTFDTDSFARAVNAAESIGVCDLQVEYEDVICTAPDSRVYRDSFFVSASAFPGNIASAFAVYFFPRNYWLGEFSFIPSGFLNPPPSLPSFRLVLFHSIIFLALRVK